MVLTSADNLVQVLRQCHFLEPGQLRKLQRVSEARGLDAHGMAQYALSRNWLTPFQVNQILAGRGQGLHLGPYIILERLGEGGMAQVFKARHHLIDRIVALKLIRPDHLQNRDAVARFRRETQAAAQLSHPNIVLAFDADEVNGKHFFVMEYMEGTDLSRLVKSQGPLPVAQAADYVRQAALGLQHASEKGMVHRDIKPSNLVVTSPSASTSSSPKWGLLKILDMGLARLNLADDVKENTELTHVGHLIGTPEYLAPEQAANPHDADVRADLYSLGCSFYFLLTGQVPFPGGTAIDKLFRHRLEQAKPVEVLRPEVPVDLAAVVRTLMAKRPEDRYQQPNDLVAVLEPWIARNSGSRPLPTRQVKERMAAITTAERGQPPRLATETATGPSRTPIARPAPAAARSPVPAPSTTARRELWRRQTVIGGCVLLGCLALFAFLLSFDLRSSKGRKDDATGGEESRDPLARFLARAEQPQTDIKQLRQEIDAYRLQNAGTPAGRRAADLLNQIPGPLDDFDPRQVPPENRIEGGPGDLVALLGDPRLRHGGHAFVVAYSPDGKTLASGGEDRTVYLWDAANGKKRIALMGHGGPIAGVAWADGKTLVSSSHDGTVRVWDVPGRKERHVLRHPTHVRGIAISANGKLVITASHGEHGLPGGGVRVWDVQSGKELFRLDGHHGVVHGVAISPDSQLIASGGEDKTIRLWDVVQHKELAVLRGHDGNVYSIVFSADGKTLASGGHDKTVRLWDIAQRKEKAPAKDCGHHVTSVMFQPKTAVLAAAVHDGSVRVWDTANGQDRATLRGHHGAVQSAAFSPDGQTIASAGHDATVRLWDWAKQQEKPQGDRTFGWATVAALAPDDQTIATGHRGGKVRLWDVPSLRKGAVFEKHQHGVMALAFSPDGKMLLSSGWDNIATLWDLGASKERFTLRGHQHPIVRLGFGPGGSIAVTASHDQTARLWDTATGTEKFVLQGHGHALHSAAIAPDGKTVATGSHDRVVKFWDAATGKEKGSLGEFSGETMLFLPDGKALVTGSQHGSVRLWDLTGPKPTEGRTLAGVNIGWIKSLALSPDGKVLAIGSHDGRLVLYGLAVNKELRQWQLSGSINGLAYAVDGRHLLCVNANGTVALFRLALPEKGRRS
ncbi:MAG: serine/threonine protein kinase [Gemmataceae bacterium]|nr:serine/threonine protein kinase [Gemmataceae bacterium]